MKKILFPFLLALCLISCKEDLSDYNTRLDQRETANEALNKSNAGLGASNDEQARRNAEIAAMLSRLKLDGEALQYKLDSLEGVTVVSANPQLFTMGFATKENSVLSQDVSCEIIGDSIIECWLPSILHEKYLKPRFTFRGTLVTIDDMEAASGVTMFDFTKPVTVTVHTSRDSHSYKMYVHSYTGLPVLYINVSGGREVKSKDEYLDATVRLVEDVKTRAPGDVIEAPAQIKGRGNSSWLQPKKPYRLKFTDKVALLGEHKDRSWVLIHNYSDKSMLRNSVSFYLGHMSNLEWTPASHFVEVVMNGRYDGTYLLCEKIKQSNHRVAVGDDGFILENDRWPDRDESNVYFTTQFVNSSFVIKEPEGVTTGDENYNYISSYIKTCENVLFSNYYTDPDIGWQKYMDMDSFVDWYLIHEISKNVDCMFNFSTYMHLARGGKLKMGPIWDFDIAYGNVKESNSDYLKYVFPDGNLLAETRWYSRLMTDPAFVARLKERFKYYYSHKNDILNYVNEMAVYLRYSVEKNEERWGTLYHFTYKNYDIWGSYWNEVQDLKEWINARFEWMKSDYGL